MSAPVMCPECHDGKCRNCDGRAWSDELDDVVECACSHPGQPAPSACTCDRETFLQPNGEVWRVKLTPDPDRPCPQHPPAGRDDPPELPEDPEPGELPPPVPAARRVLDFVAWFGDGDVADAFPSGPALFARDLVAVASAVLEGRGLPVEGFGGKP